MKVSECFMSLQGEGVNSGIPMYFIRLYGCDLRCRWCDTKYAWDGDYDEKTPTQLAEGVSRACSWRDLNRWVCVTGGEPLLQEGELQELVRLLRSRFFHVEIETNGTHRKPWWYRGVDCWVTDIKCPSSGWAPAEDFLSHWFAGRTHDCVKFVVANEADLVYAKDVLRKHRRTLPSPRILVSPVANPDGGWDRSWLQQVWDFCLVNDLRFSLQVHKIVWGMKKGV